MNISDLICKNYEEGNLEDADLVQILEQISDYLRLQTLTNYAKAEKISYNGAKKRSKNTVNIDGVVFVINNE